MFRSLLVPLDGSSFGEHALPLALSIARRAKARLELVHVHTPLSSPEINLPAFAADDRRARERARDYLDGLVRRLSTCPPVEVRTHLEEGRAVDALCEFAASRSIDLVVLTTHGRGPLSRLWFGSVATELVQRAPAPLLLVRPSEERADVAAEPVPRRFLIPLDGSEFAEQILPLAATLGALTGADYRLLRVVSPVLMGGWETPSESQPALGRSVSDLLEIEAKDYLAKVIARWPALSAAQRQVTVDWPPTAAILADADAHAIDVIALATHGRGGLTSLLLGSVADKIVRGSSTAVLLFRPVDQSQR
jgi:nucleotide-binding universal stress UspA family protein